MKQQRLLLGASLQGFAKPAYWRRFLLLAAMALCSGDLAIAEFSDNTPAEEAAESLTWPMLPGESLNHLAILFYPGNKSMQRRFVSKTLELSRDIDPALNPASVFKQPAMLIIPDLKALSRHASPFKPQRHKSSSLRLHLSYQLKDAVKSIITPEMHAIYEDLVKRNKALKLQLESLNQRFATLQSSLETLKSAALIFLRQSAPTVKPIAVVPAPVPAAVPVAPPVALDPVPAVAAVVAAPARLAATAPPVRQPARPALEAAESGWIILLAECGALLLGLVLAIAAWAWIRKRLARQLENKTDKQLEALHKNDFDPMQSALPNSTTMDGADPGILSVEEIDSVVEEARIFVSMGRTKEATELLAGYIEDLPKAALAPWLYLMDIYRSLDQKEQFVALAKRFHQTFNVMTPLWEETKVALVVADSLEQFAHIVPNLVVAWQAGNAKQYLDTLLADNRDGERTGFGIAVLEEIIMLLGVLEIRDEVIQPALAA